MARKKDVLIKNRNLWGWIFSIQTVIAILVTLIYPLVYAGVLSFTNVRFTTVNSKDYSNHKIIVVLFPEPWYYPAALSI